MATAHRASTRGASSARGRAGSLRSGELAWPAARRLAFRELGLAIGLAAMERLGNRDFAPYADLRDTIISFWNKPEHRELRAGMYHQDINEVILATALCPDGVL